ncbi:unnamed protein product [Mytilus coruscus]|uniref:Ig-like domain-containing protein n=1 Tax=Mytilus coruscus TaxID=42192 RepID=A0A6J8BSG5_MYTCO|nr:unnamed protein product [Mytilus coruscus]
MITLTCKGNGNPEPTYIWFEEGKNNHILSNKSVYVIENVIGNQSGVYICEVYNIIEDVNYRKSNSVKIDIGVDLQKSDLNKPNLTNEARENEENYYQTLSHDGITVNPEYASVIHTNNTSVGEAGDSFVRNYHKEGNKNKSRNNVVDRAVIYDEVNQQANLNYESSKTDTPVRNDNSGFDVSTKKSIKDGDALQTGYLTCREVNVVTSVQDPNNYEDLMYSDRTVVNDEINQQTTLKSEVSKAEISLPNDNVDHDAVTIISAVNAR